VSGRDRAARRLLLASAALGIALAAFAILRSGRGPERAAPGAIAVVNGRAISREAFARFAGAVAEERRRMALDAGERRRLLSRMIDEELLLQRGIELELPRHEPTARRSIVSALIASVAADAELSEPDEAELRAFWDGNRERFTRPDRLVLDVALVAAGDEPEAATLQRARELARRVREGEDFARVRQELGDAPIAALPEGAQGLDTIRQYLGPSAARAAEELGEGETCEPVRGSPGYYVLRLRERVAGGVAPFDDVREHVRVELLRERGDAALRDYLAELRSGADVRILDPELDGS
jgi:parvulin-like peptidyl-prolyl isomerase